jgi:hypothetical protein
MVALRDAPVLKAVLAEFGSASLKVHRSSNARLF